MSRSEPATDARRADPAPRAVLGRTPSPRVRRALRGAGLACGAYYALWACAPAATHRPLALDPGQTEIGLAATASGPVGESDTCSTLLGGCGGADGQLWVQRRLGEHVSLGGTLFGGSSSVIGTGGMLRFHLVERDRFRLGLDLEGGFLWGGLALPVSFRFAERIYLYSAPSFGLRALQPVRLPVGVSVGLTERVHLQAEAAWGYDPLTYGFGDPFSGDYWTGSLAGSVRF